MGRPGRLIQPARSTRANWALSQHLQITGRCFVYCGGRAFCKQRRHLIKQHLRLISCITFLFFRSIYVFIYMQHTLYCDANSVTSFLFFYFFSGEIGQKQNGTRFPLTSDGVMSSRLNSHFFHDDQCKCSCQLQSKK